jgi:hypothetical protein
MLQFKKTSANLPYLEKNEEYDPNYLQNESTSRKISPSF